MTVTEVVDTFVFWEFYKVELLRNGWNMYIRMTHIPTGFEREMEIDIAEDYLFPLVKVINDFIQTHDMVEYMQMVNEIKEKIKEDKHNG